MFLLYLEGGYWCFNLASCDQRSADFGARYMSSQGWPDTIAAEGLLSRYDYSEIAYVYYCSSDAHVANQTLTRAPGSIPAEWQFRGRVVINAALKFLRMRGLGANDQRLILSGGSSGARGAMWLYEDIKEEVPNVEVLGIFDSPLWTTQPVFEDEFLGFSPARWYSKNYRPALFHVSLEENVKLFIDTFQRSLSPSIYGKECSNFYAGHERWKCLLGEYRIRFVKAPYLVSASQYDGFALSYSMGGPQLACSPTAAASRYRESFRSTIRKSLATAHGSVFSTACYRHVMTTSNKEYAAASKGCPALSVAVDRFLESPHTKFSYIANCQGFDCGCPGDFYYLYGFFFAAVAAVLAPFFVRLVAKKTPPHPFATTAELRRRRLVAAGSARPRRWWRLPPPEALAPRRPRELLEIHLALNQNQTTTRPLQNR